MRFSEHFGVERTPEDDWFDPVLSTDTRLFVDPFRIFVEEEGRWAGAHPRLIGFFNLVLGLVAAARRNRASAHWRASTRLLMFPEPHEFCLGYSLGSPLGAGAGRGLQQGMLDGAEVAVELGLGQVSHFEELALFEAGIGADRISDVVCNVLKSDFTEYTQEICRRHDTEMENLRVVHAGWSRDRRRWENEAVLLPKNPFTNRAVLLTPQRFLRELPTVDPLDFWEWAWTNKNEDIRGEFNYEIGRGVDREQIARFARMHPQIVHRYVEHLEQDPKPAYDVDHDPSLEVKWYELGAQFAARVALRVVPTEPDGFCEFVRSIIGAFVHNVEEQDGWQLLWANNRPRSERIVQALFRSTVIHYCRANDIDLAGEANAGRGPVDFKFSQGWERRALTEVKLTSNTRFWRGLERQTPQYMRSEEIQCGFFVAVGFSDPAFDRERIDRVHGVADRVSKETGYVVTPVLVDGRPKSGASRA